MRVCSKCGGVGEFSRDKAARDGLASWCCRCKAAHERAKYREKSLARARDMAAANLRRCSACRVSKELVAENFYPSPVRYARGFNYMCITCMRSKERERRQMRAMAQNRGLAKSPKVLERVERAERRAEMAEIGGLRGVHSLASRCRAVRCIKVLLRGEEIPADVLDAILPP